MIVIDVMVLDVECIAGLWYIENTPADCDFSYNLFYIESPSGSEGRRKNGIKVMSRGSSVDKAASHPEPTSVSEQPAYCDF